MSRHSFYQKLGGPNRPADYWVCAPAKYRPFVCLTDAGEGPTLRKPEDRWFGPFKSDREAAAFLARLGECVHE